VCVVVVGEVGGGAGAEPGVRWRFGPYQPWSHQWRPPSTSTAPAATTRMSLAVVWTPRTVAVSVVVVGSMQPTSPHLSCRPWKGRPSASMCPCPRRCTCLRHFPFVMCDTLANLGFLIRCAQEVAEEAGFLIHSRSTRDCCSHQDLAPLGAHGHSSPAVLLQCSLTFTKPTTLTYQSFTLTH
jgi:hypothetical protein